jgi:hypothetical protein
MFSALSARHARVSGNGDDIFGRYRMKVGDDGLDKKEEVDDLVELVKEEEGDDVIRLVELQKELDQKPPASNEITVDINLRQPSDREEIIDVNSDVIEVLPEDVPDLENIDYIRKKLKGGEDAISWLANKDQSIPNALAAAISRDPVVLDREDAERINNKLDINLFKDSRKENDLKTALRMAGFTLDDSVTSFGAGPMIKLFGIPKVIGAGTQLNEFKEGEGLGYAPTLQEKAFLHDLIYWIANGSASARAQGDAILLSDTVDFLKNNPSIPNALLSALVYAGTSALKGLNSLGLPSDTKKELTRKEIEFLGLVRDHEVELIREKVSDLEEVEVIDWEEIETFSDGETSDSITWNEVDRLNGGGGDSTEKISIFSANKELILNSYTGKAPPHKDMSPEKMDFLNIPFARDMIYGNGMAQHFPDIDTNKINLSAMAKTTKVLISSSQNASLDGYVERGLYLNATQFCADNNNFGPIIECKEPASHVELTKISSNFITMLERANGDYAKVMRNFTSVWNTTGIPIAPITQKFKGISEGQTASSFEEQILMCMLLATNYYTDDSFFPGRRQIEDETCGTTTSFTRRAYVNRVGAAPSIYVFSLADYWANLSDTSQIWNTAGNPRFFFQINGMIESALGPDFGQHNVGLLNQNCYSEGTMAAAIIALGGRCNVGYHYDELLENIDDPIHIKSGAWNIDNQEIVDVIIVLVSVNDDQTTYSFGPDGDDANDPLPMSSPGNLDAVDFNDYVDSWQSLEYRDFINASLYYGKFDSAYVYQSCLAKVGRMITFCPTPSKYLHRDVSNGVDVVEPKMSTDPFGTEGSICKMYYRGSNPNSVNGTRFGLRVLNPMVNSFVMVGALSIKDSNTYPKNTDLLQDPAVFDIYVLLCGSILQCALLDMCFYLGISQVSLLTSNDDMRDILTSYNSDTSRLLNNYVLQYFGPPVTMAFPADINWSYNMQNTTPRMSIDSNRDFLLAVMGRATQETELQFCLQKSILMEWYQDYYLGNLNGGGQNLFAIKDSIINRPPEWANICENDELMSVFQVPTATRTVHYPNNEDKLSTVVNTATRTILYTSFISFPINGLYSTTVNGLANRVFKQAFYCGGVPVPRNDVANLITPYLVPVIDSRQVDNNPEMLGVVPFKWSRTTTKVAIKATPSYLRPSAPNQVRSRLYQATGSEKMGSGKDEKGEKGGTGEVPDVPVVPVDRETVGSGLGISGNQINTATGAGDEVSFAQS